MKKLISLSLAILALLSLTACGETDTNPVVETNDPTGTITIEVTDEEGEIDSYQASIYEDLELIEIIESEVEVTYTGGGANTFLTGIGSISSQYGSYVAFSKNGEMAGEGVGTITFEDGDVFGFEISWWDSSAKAVYDAINLFLENQVDTYINENTIDYNVLAALELLGLEEDYVTEADVTDFYTDFTPVTAGDYFKIILAYKALGMDASGFADDLKLAFQTGPYGETAYFTLALQNVDSTYVESDLYTTIIDYYETNTPTDAGLDTGGISLVALGSFDNLQAEDTTVVTAFTAWIKESQLPSGGLVTRDVTYGDTTYPGTENAATISQVILGLVANGENPASALYKVENNSLVTRLTEFQTETGAFNWLIDDAEADLAFSTPQAFLALVTVHIHLQTNEAVNPYIID